MFIALAFFSLSSIHSSLQFFFLLVVAAAIITLIVIILCRSIRTVYRAADSIAYIILLIAFFDACFFYIDFLSLACERNKRNKIRKSHSNCPASPVNS